MGEFKLPRLIKKTALEPEFDPAKLRAKQIARENKERFERIAQRLLEVLGEEKVTVIELPVIVSILTGKVNQRIDGAEIEQILNLNEENDKTQG